MPEPIVVNCTGLGSADIFGDTKLVPIKGQLVLVKAQPALQYLYSSDETYVFPRDDHVVVGGSYEFHVWDPLDPYKCLAILKMAKDVFAGHAYHPDAAAGLAATRIPVTHALSHR